MKACTVAPGELVGQKRQRGLVADAFYDPESALGDWNREAPTLSPADREHAREMLHTFVQDQAEASQSSRHIATTSRSGVRSGGPRGTGSRGGVAGAAPLAGAELVDAPQLRGAEEVTLDDDDQPQRLLGDGVGVAHCGGGGGSDMALADAENSATVVEH